MGPMEHLQALPGFGEERQPLPLREMDSPYVIVANNAFALSAENVLKPYPHQDLTLEQRVCNYRFSRAHRIVENVVGILANQWGFLWSRPVSTT